MEFEYRGKTVKIDDDYWNGDLVEEVRKRIQGDLKLLTRYEGGETLNGLLITSFVGEEGKEEEFEIPITIKKPIPLLGRVKLELPEEGLTIKFPRLKTSKTISLDEKTLVQKEEGTIEQVEN